MKQIRCTITGTSPLLMNAFPLVRVEALDKKTPAEQAAVAEYRDPDTGEIYIPAVAVQRAFVGAAVYSKGKGRGSLQRQVAASVLVSPERLTTGLKDYVIDSRPVVIAATKGRIVRHRPRLDQWGVSFDIEYDENLLTEAQLRRVVDDAGSRCGLLDFRPEKKGPFGRYMVTEWKAA